MHVEDIAKACHEVNAAYCKATGETSLPWEQVKESAVRGVQFALDNPDATPESQHEAWMNDKKADGWVYGPEKDAEKKTHHCLVPYADLPAAQKTKDYLFQAVVHSLKPFLTLPEARFQGPAKPAAQTA